MELPHVVWRLIAIKCFLFLFAIGRWCLLMIVEVILSNFNILGEEKNPKKATAMQSA